MATTIFPLILALIAITIMTTKKAQGDPTYILSIVFPMATLLVATVIVGLISFLGHLFLIIL